MGLFGFIKNIANGNPKPKKNEKSSRTMILNTLMGSAHWPTRDYSNFALESYMKNVISFRCVFYIASSLSSVKWGLFKKDNKSRIEITDHPIVTLLKRANPNESFNFVMQKLLSFILISGNGYLEKVSPSSGIPKELYSLRPDKVTMNTDPYSGRITKYVYDQRIDFMVDPITGKGDLLQIKTFHPLDDFFGLSITEPASREIDSSNEMTEWQKKVFENEGRPGMMVFVNGFLSDDQWDRLEKQLKTMHNGTANAGKDLIIEGESLSDAKPYSWSPKEMDWIESNREMARKICIGYGVHPMLLGIPGDNTYSNFKEARAAFWEETEVYWLELLKGELNNWFFQDNSIFIDFDLSQIPALAYKQEMIWSRIKDCNFMTLNEKREAVGMEKIPGGDIILIPMGMTTLDQINAEDDSSDPADQNQDQQTEDDLVSQGFDRDLAKRMVGNIF